MKKYVLIISCILLGSTAIGAPLWADEPEIDVPGPDPVQRVSYAPWDPDEPLPQGNLARARAIFEYLLTVTPQDPDLSMYLGDIYGAYNDMPQAQKFYLDYADMRPQDYYPYYQLGTLYWNNDRKNRAKNYYLEGLSRMPPAPYCAGEPLTAEYLLMAEIATARMNALVGNEELADEEFARLLQNHPHSAEVANVYVNTLIDQKRYDEALAFSESYYETHPASYQQRLNMARVYFFNYQYDKAEPILEELLQQRPQDVDIISQYAYLKQAQRDYFGALPAFDTLRDVYPDNEDTLNARDSVWRETRPTLRWGGSFIRNGTQNHYGPYVNYYHPIDSTWAFSAGWSGLRNTGNIAGFDPDYVAYSNTVNIMGYYRPYWSVLLGFGLENQLVDNSYSPAPHIMAIWDDPRVGRFGFDFIYNGIMYDPTEGMYFGGKEDTLLLTYSRTIRDFVILSAYYGSNWYRVSDTARTGLGLGKDFGREDIAGAAVQFIVFKQPDIIIGYGLDYSNLHIKNNYLPVIPLIQESLAHNFLFNLGYDWNRWIRTEIGGFVGGDPKRNLGYGQSWGTNIANRIRVNERFEIVPWYAYSSESPTAATTGHYHTGGLDFLYRF